VLSVKLLIFPLGVNTKSSDIGIDYYYSMERVNCFCK